MRQEAVKIVKNLPFLLQVRKNTYLRVVLDMFKRINPYQNNPILKTMQYNISALGVLLLFLTSMATNYALAQSGKFGGGLILDPEKYEQVPLASPLTNKSLELIPYKHSLKPYCPNPGDQLGTGTCVGWAAAYGAQTIIEAIANGWERSTHLATLNANAFSPSYVYRKALENEQKSYDCYLGIHIADALMAMQLSGNLKINEYPFDENCTLTPTPSQISMAERYKLKGFLRVSFVNEDNAKVSKIRHCLADNMPVIVGMMVYENFKELYHDNHTWNPNKGDKGQPTIHAMLVVGYDDETQTFELMNSWGTEWANNGFIYVKYEDFNKYTKEAYQLLYDPPMPLAAKKYAANIAYRELGRTQQGDAANCTSEIIGTMRATQNGAVYSMENIYNNNTNFQIHLTPKSPNMFIYGFSIDDNNVIDLLHPLTSDMIALYDPKAHNTTISARVPTTKGTIAIPHEDYCMELDATPGTMNVFLFSKSEIDLNQLRQQMPLTSGNILDRLKVIFPDRLANRNQITYHPNMSFEADLDDMQIVPMVIDLNHLPKKP